MNKDMNLDTILMFQVNLDPSAECFGWLSKNAAQ